MKSSRILFREKTRAKTGVGTETIFNSPGMYKPPYGKSTIQLAGRGATGTPGNASYSYSYSYTTTNTVNVPAAYGPDTFSTYVPSTCVNAWYGPDTFSTYVPATYSVYAVYNPVCCYYYTSGYQYYAQYSYNHAVNTQQYNSVGWSGVGWSNTNPSPSSFDNWVQGKTGYAISYSYSSPVNSTTGGTLLCFACTLINAAYTYNTPCYHAGYTNAAYTYNTPCYHSAYSYNVTTPVTNYTYVSGNAGSPAAPTTYRSITFPGGAGGAADTAGSVAPTISYTTIGITETDAFVNGVCVCVPPGGYICFKAI